MPGLDEVIESAVSEAGSETASESATGEESTQDTTAERADGVTGEQTGSSEEQPAETKPEGGESAAGSEQDAEASEWRNANVPEAFYNRFKDVNSKAQTYEEALTELIDNPDAYRELVKRYTGRDPFDGVAPSGAKAEADTPEPDTVAGKIAALPQLSREDFATETDWNVYQATIQALNTVATEVDSLKGKAAETDQERQQREIVTARAHFDETVSKIESDLGIQLSIEEKCALANEAKAYSNMPVKDAVLKASKVVFFDRARQLGREEAAKIADDKIRTSGGRPPAAGASGGSQRTGLPLMDAIMQACSENGVH